MPAWVLQIFWKRQEPSCAQTSPTSRAHCLPGTHMYWVPLLLVKGATVPKTLTAPRHHSGRCSWSLAGPQQGLETFPCLPLSRRPRPPSDCITPSAFPAQWDPHKLLLVYLFIHLQSWGLNAELLG